MFASFPYWYASLFSGYYLILFTILFGLIIRGVSLNSAITCRKVNVVGCGTGHYQLVVSLYRSSWYFVYQLSPRDAFRCKRQYACAIYGLF